MVTFMPAAPIDGAAVLPGYLIDQYLKADNDDQAGLIYALRLTALSWVERHTSRSLQRRRWVAMFDGFDTVMRLPVEPVSSVFSVGYVDADGNTVDAAGSWQAAGDHLFPMSGLRWPTTASRPGAVIVAFEAGFVDVSIEAPALQIAALLMMKHLFDGGSFEDVPATISMLLDTQYRTPVMR